MLGWLAQEEFDAGISALAGMAGPQRICASSHIGRSVERSSAARHSGMGSRGGMVPEDEMEQYAKGRYARSRVPEDGSTIPAPPSPHDGAIGL